MSRSRRIWNHLVDENGKLKPVSGSESGSTGARGLDGSKGQKGAEGVGENGAKGQKGATGGLPILAFHASWDASAGDSFDWSTDQIGCFGIDNVVRTAKGIFDITFPVPLLSANYTVVASAGDQNYGGVGASPRAMNVLNRTTTGFTVICERTDDAAQDDCGYIALVVLGSA